MGRMSRDELREEIREFREQYNLEQARFGGWVPATMLLNTGLMLRELLLRGYIISNGVGFAPAGKADRHG